MSQDEDRCGRIFTENECTRMYTSVYVVQLPGVECVVLQRVGSHTSAENNKRRTILLRGVYM